jgi:hypothetical protein
MNEILNKKKKMKKIKVIMKKKKVQGKKIILKILKKIFLVIMI